MTSSNRAPGLVIAIPPCRLATNAFSPSRSQVNSRVRPSPRTPLARGASPLRIAMASARVLEKSRNAAAMSARSSAGHALCGGYRAGRLGMVVSTARTLFLRPRRLGVVMEPSVCEVGRTNVIGGSCGADALPLSRNAGPYCILCIAIQCELHRDCQIRKHDWPQLAWFDTIATRPTGNDVADATHS